ncbi:MAG TPA: hypothetical protein VFS26_06755 [Solirubrobacterales bacterium]|nr:hypothetical protein [Solirubrobacterales bacterium]
MFGPGEHLAHAFESDPLVAIREEVGAHDPGTADGRLFHRIGIEIDLAGVGEGGAQRRDRIGKGDLVLQPLGGHAEFPLRDHQ